MRRLGFCVSVLALVVNGCGSSGGGGTGGSGAAAGNGGGAGTAGGAAGSSGKAGASGGAGTTGGAGAGGHAGASGGAGTTGGAGAGAGGAGATCGSATGSGSGDSCSTVTTTGPCVTETFSTATPQIPAGGAFAAGTYNLTSLTDYLAADAAVPTNGLTARQTYVVSNVTSTSLTLAQAESSGTVLDRSSGTVAISGMSATYTATCPVTDAGNQGGTDQFTASASGFTLFEARGNGETRVSVFAKAN
jgi:hypothetical protein